MIEFDFGEAESAGTLQFLGYAGPFLNTLREGSILIVDEFDARLHPLLTKQLVALFNSSANQKNAQLIFAAHDQGLLDQRKIRRDQVWFVEKNPQASSELFTLAEITGVRRDANFEKEYLLGIFGGVPHLGDFNRALEVNAE
jgi:AAA15 family ATPase/GTPase